MLTTEKNLRYPIGKFSKPKELYPEMIDEYISEIASFPARLRQAVAGLNDGQLDTEYRSGGWTVRQVVHHCADSHMNSLTRFKLALTEDAPTIKPYYEDRWAELMDSKNLELEPSLKMLEGIHARWSVLLKGLTTEQLSRTFVHPEHGRVFRLDENIGLYAWHCNHHLAHILSLRKRMQW